MKIEWNKVTWYSWTLTAIVFLVIIPLLTIYFIGQYKEIYFSQREDIFVPTVVKQAPKFNHPFEEIAVPLSRIQNLTMTTSGRVSVAKGIIANINGQTATTTLEAGQVYLMYLSGVTGFTEFIDSTSSEKYVELAGTVRIYDNKNNIILANEDIFSAYSDKIQIETAKYLNSEIDFQKQFFPAGDYHWEVIVTDKKNSTNTLKVVFNFKINVQKGVDTASSTESQKLSLDELQTKYAVADKSGINKVMSHYINFNKETYYLAFSSFDERVYSLQFFRSKDDLNNFDQAFQVLYYNKINYDSYLKKYIPPIKNRLAINEDVYEMPFGDGQETLSFYTYDKDSNFIDYNLQKISSIDVNTVRVEIFYKKYPIPQNPSDWQKINDDVKNNMPNWTNNNGIYFLDYQIK